jgi:hypothetical protein
MIEDARLRAAVLESERAILIRNFGEGGWRDMHYASVILFALKLSN